MHEHLKNEDLIEALGRGSRSGAEDCRVCRDERDTIAKALARLQEWTRSEVERPDEFWESNLRRLRVALKNRPAHARRLSWGWTAAAAIILALTVARVERLPQPETQTVTDPDHQLLIEVQRTVRREVPEALEPAALLIQEIRRASSAGAHQGEKR